jgi:gliding motility-associated-like protein
VRITDANNCEKLANGIVDDATNCLFVRAVITPEGDGRNEEFKIGCLSRFSDNKLEIYNRWGQLVYETVNYNDGNLWRGENLRGQPVPDGVYYYVFEYTDPGSKQRLNKKGSVSVLRR